MLMAGTATANGQYASDTKIRVLCFSAESEKQTLRGRNEFDDSNSDDDQWY